MGALWETFCRFLVDFFNFFIFEIIALEFFHVFIGFISIGSIEKYVTDVIFM